MPTTEGEKGGQGRPYNSAEKIGEEGGSSVEKSFENDRGKEVSFRFRGRVIGRGTGSEKRNIKGRYMENLERVRLKECQQGERVGGLKKVFP